MTLRRLYRRRIQQGDVTVLALELAAARQNGHISTTALKAFMMDKFKPTEEDAIPTANGHTPLFDQIVSNIISNRKMPNSMFSKGYAEYVNDGIRITPKGRDFLEAVPR